MVSIVQSVDSANRALQGNEDKQMILGHFEFESEGSPLSMTFWHGKDNYQFLTNFIGVYPFNSHKIPGGVAGYQAEKKDLEDLLLRKTCLGGLGFSRSQQLDVHGKEYYSETLENGVVRFYMDKSEFSRLPEEVRKKFLTKYKQHFLWDVGFLRKARFDEWLEEVLIEKASIDRHFKHAFDEMLAANISKRQCQLGQAFKIIDDNYAANDFEKQIIPVFFKEIGYLASPEQISCVNYIFKETHYSPSSIEELNESLSKIALKLKLAGPSSSALFPEKEDADQELKKKFSQRLFETCKIALEGNNPLTGSKKAYDYIPKHEQSIVIDRLKELLSARKIYIRNSEYSADIKYQLGELLQAVRDRNAASSTIKDFKRVLANKKPLESYSDSLVSGIRLLESRVQSLEAAILKDDVRNSISLDYEKQRALLHLEIMGRNYECKPVFRHIKFLGLATTDDLLRLPIAFYDIEKFQYGSIKEKVDGCATIVRTQDLEFEAQLDFLKPVPDSNMQGFKVKSHEYPRNLVKSIGDFITANGSFAMISYGSYDPKQLSKTREFYAGTKFRKLIPRQRVHLNFIERYEGVGSSINLLTLMKMVFPHFQDTKLATIINYLEKKSGQKADFSKAFTHEELRSADRSAERLLRQGDALSVEKALTITQKLAFYTVDDVIRLTQPLFSVQNKWLWDDLLEACRAFQVTIDQASSSYNFSTHLVSRNYFERFGTFLNKGDMYKEYERAKKNFMHTYAIERVKGLERSNASFNFEKGIITGVDMLYFSPEMLITPVLCQALPQIEGYVKKTLEYKDPERQVARLQLMKPLIINALMHNHLIQQWQERLEQRRKQLNHIKEDRLAADAFFQTGNKSRSEAHKGNDLKIAKDKAASVKKIRKAEELLRAEKVSFNRQYGLWPHELSQAVELAYSIAANAMELAGAKPILAKGSFIFARGGEDGGLLAASGLFKLREGMTIYRMGQGRVTYKSNSSYAGYPAKLHSPNNHYSMLELQTIKAVLDSIFRNEFDVALEKARLAYIELTGLEEKLSSPESKDSTLLFRKLQTYNRNINRYLGVIAMKNPESTDSTHKTVYVKAKYTPDQRDNFKPLKEYYLGKYALKFFGISPATAEVDITATLPTLFSGFINFGDDKKPVSEEENNARQSYAKLFNSRRAALEEFILA